MTQPPSAGRKARPIGRDGREGRVDALTVGVPVAFIASIVTSTFAGQETVVVVYVAVLLGIVLISAAALWVLERREEAIFRAALTAAVAARGAGKHGEALDDATLAEMARQVDRWLERRPPEDRER